MKLKISIIGCCLLIFTGLSGAQTLSGRDVNTLITSILAQLPAENARQYELLMKELVDTGTEGVSFLVGQINAPGKGDNSKIDYALSGMSFFASGDGSLKRKMEEAYIAVLDEIKEPETKAFIISQFAFVGSEVGIRKLSDFLSDDGLCGPAARAISSIGGEIAGKSLLMALMKRVARSPETERHLIQALGAICEPVEGREELLKTKLVTNDLTTKSVVLQALSRTGSKSSLPDLGAAAAATGYRPEITDACSAYIRLIKRVYEQGDRKEAMAAANQLLANVTKSGSTPLRIATLEVLFYNQTDRLKTLKAALNDNNKPYRIAALNYASPYADKVLYTELFKMLPKIKPAEQIDILNWIGEEALSPEKRQILKTVETRIDIPAIQTLIQLMNDKLLMVSPVILEFDPETEVRIAAARALGALGDKSALPALTELLQSNNPQLLACAKSVLSSFPADISPALAKMVSKASDEGKIIILELLAGRKANVYFNLGLELTKSKNLKVQQIAYDLLNHVVSEKDFVVLCGMIETSDQLYIKPLQQAIVSAIASLTAGKQTEAINNRILLAGDDKKYLYYPVLVSTNDPAALSMILQDFNTENGILKEAAFEALLLWKGFEVEEALYAICKSADIQFVEKAIGAYISLVTTYKLSDESRLSYLQKALEIVKTEEQKKILNAKILDINK